VCLVRMPLSGTCTSSCLVRTSSVNTSVRVSTHINVRKLNECSQHLSREWLPSPLTTIMIITVIYIFSVRIFRYGSAAVQYGASHGATRCYKRTATNLPFTAHPSHHPSLIMSSSDLPLPYGWVQEFDPKTNHPFWVSDTSVPSPYYIHD
jgi:hypothetical protein